MYTVSCLTGKLSNLRIYSAINVISKVKDRPHGLAIQQCTSVSMYCLTFGPDSGEISLIDSNMRGFATY